MNNKVEIYFHKFLSTYTNLSAPVKASLWFTICSILQKGIAMITLPIFTRLMSTEQYGVYSVYMSWYSIISIFATLNLFAGVFNNGMIKYEKDKEKFISSLQGLSTMTTGILICIYISAIEFWNKFLGLPTLLVCVIFIQLLFEPAYLFWSARQKYEYKYKELVVITILISVTSPLLCVISVISTAYKIEARVIGFALVQVCVGIGFYIYNIYRGRTFFNKEFWKFGLVFNIPLIPHYLSMSVLGQADRIMINQMVGSDKAAIYSVAYSISSLMTLVTVAINNSFIPYTYKAISEKKYKAIRRNSNTLLIVVGVTVLLVMLFGPEIVRIFAPIEYYEAIWIIPPVAVSVYFMFLYPLFGNIEFYFEKTIFIMIASCIGAVANVILNFLFIPIYGYIAAGYTTLACYMMFAFGHYIFYKMIIKKNDINEKIYDIKFIVSFSSIVLIIMLLTLFIYNYTKIRYGLLVTLILVIIIKRKYIIEQMKAIMQR